MFNRSKKISFLLFLLQLPVVYSQSQNDSLLEKIRDIDISLIAPVDSEENLYLNTVSFQSFYDILSPMGEWIQITKEDIDEDMSDGDGEGFSSVSEGDEDFLFIWKPAVENNWKPYVNGKWEYTNQGWLWISKDNWGNSTYNYGRWWNAPKYGWVWLPGYTWAPAWVRWKVSPDYSNIGWVALSPKAKWKSEKGITNGNYKFTNKDEDWVFVDHNTFVDEINTSKILGASQNSALVKNSVTLTDIKTEDDMVINNGPDVTNIEKKTGRKLAKKKIRFFKERANILVSTNEVLLNRESFKKYNIDKNNNKPLITDKPKKFKRSERVKKLIRKLKRHKKLHNRYRNR